MNKQTLLDELQRRDAGRQQNLSPVAMLLLDDWYYLALAMVAHGFLWLAK